MTDCLLAFGYCLSEVAHITDLGRTCQTLLSKNPNKFNYKALQGDLLNVFNLAVKRVEEALVQCGVVSILRFYRKPATLQVFKLSV